MYKKNWSSSSNPAFSYTATQKLLELPTNIELWPFKLPFFAWMNFYMCVSFFAGAIMKTLRQDAHVHCAPLPSPAQSAGGGIWRSVHARLIFRVFTRAEIRNSAPEITAGLIIDPGHVLPCSVRQGGLCSIKFASLASVGWEFGEPGARADACPAEGGGQRRWSIDAAPGSSRKGWFL